ncbi:unnamed protein product [Rhizoctonia solani]|uniref:FAD-binding PCMH-type domain-containing protein n=1 Tax=Rhizoctonia solani TaxID=456999 RepID=A0A8H2WY21_9AGAM|nr:unnamed protein product [Rhizoctonia solani]
MVRGFTFTQRLSATVLLAVGVSGLSNICCDKLTKALSGDKVLSSYNPNYGAEKEKYWSLSCILTPTCIVIPESSSDVSTAIGVLVKNKCEFGIRGGGHATNPGWAGTDSGVLISLSKLNAVKVSEDKQSVVVGAGNRWGDVYAEAGKYGVTVTGGRVSPVGVSGFLLGGGLHFLMHKEGFAANSVLSYDIVLANGTVATITKESAGDLFKALKGGTGNFGIVTSFKLQTYPVDKAYAGNLQYAPEQYDKLYPIMEKYARDGIESDPKTHVIATFACAPSQGIDMASFYPFYSEPVTTPPPALKPFFDVPTTLNTVAVKTVKQAADELAVGSEARLSYDMRDFTIRANAGLFKQLFEIWHSTTIKLNSTSGWYSSIVYQAISNNMIRASDEKGGNVLGLKPADDPLILVSFSSGWASKDDDKKVLAELENLTKASMDIAKSQGLLERYIYLNYASSDQKPIEAYGPDQVDFLRKVKAKYDPNRVFEKLSRGGFKIPS